MSIIETIFQRLELAFPDKNKRTLKAASIIINIGRLIPASYVYPLPPPCTSEERLDFIRFILKKETDIDYSSNEVLIAHNILMGNENVQQQLNFDCSIEKIQHYLNEYKLLQPRSAFARNFTLLLLFPHRSICSLCNALLKIIFQSYGQVVYCTKVQPCLLYKADCHKCHRSYRLSSVYLIDQKQTLVTAESQQSDFIHFSGSTVFSKEILVSFSSQLIDDYATFEGFASATIKVFNRLHPSREDDITADNLARNLEAVWIYYELTNFLLMASKSTYIRFPYAMSEGRTRIKGQQSLRAIFIERNLNWIYHVFTTFWSNHEIVFGTCKCGNCSKVIVIDGHQKPRRIVCRYDNVTSIINATELGPINKGCPYMPRRKNSDNQESDEYAYYYCDYHRSKHADELAIETKMSDDELQKYLKYLKELDRIESQCNVGRNDMEERFESKKRSMGFIASFLNCGIITGFSDSVNHEGPRKITDHLLTMLKLGAKLPRLMVYDAACQLYKFWRYRFGTEHMQKTKYTQQLMDMILVTDRFHNTVHTATLCKTLFNPDSEQNKAKFSGINTSIAEQTFSYLTNFKTSLRSFSYPTSALFTILLFHLKNCDTLNQDPTRQALIINTDLENVIQDQQSYQSYCVFETLMMEHEINEGISQSGNENIDSCNTENREKQQN
ncbi:unnamed protein product [Adineta steineri]|uniref:CxC5 like cysteine cluster associated with KDZ domain-containing protein n=1 Tax=Adineta steineri TaxID=433720 RepID=A0A819P1N2_9BILA|nr:unnamed protein product [Adineta steineri]CAF4006065.1 unnamed protein product [Adineta steineri]